MSNYQRTEFPILLALVLVPGCGLLVDGQLDPIMCVEDGRAGAGCPSGMFCSEGECVECEARERCGNGVDDDCDGDVDDGCGGAAGDDGAGGSGTGDCRTEGCPVPGEMCIPPSSAAEAQCLRSCCSSSECPSGFVCRAIESAGFEELCVDVDSLDQHVSEVGEREVSESCAKDEDCRSAHCADEGECVDVCCEPRDCGASMQCKRASFGPWSECAPW